MRAEGCSHWFEPVLDFLVSEFGHAHGFGGAIEKGGDEALEVLLFLLQVPTEDWHGQKEHPNVGEVFGDDTDDQKLEAAKAPERDFGGERPGSVQATAEHAVYPAPMLRNRSELEAAPAATVDFQIVFAPAGIGFDGPALVFEAL